MKEETRKFNSWVHRFGISSSLILFVAMMGFPVAASAYYGIWPDFKVLWPAFIAVIVFMAPYWPAETIGYMPIMGPGALYMSYITGNVTNLRMPVTVGTINSLGIKPNTDECHTMAIIACGASCITTVVIVAAGMLVATPLQPILDAKAIQPAFNYVVPALFGGLVAQTILKGKKQFLFYLVPVAICLFFCYCTKVSSAYYMLLAIFVSAVIYVADYNRGKKKSQNQENEIDNSKE